MAVAIDNHAEWKLAYPSIIDALDAGLVPRTTYLLHFPCHHLAFLLALFLQSEHLFEPTFCHSDAAKALIDFGVLQDEHIFNSIALSSPLESDPTSAGSLFCS